MSGPDGSSIKRVRLCAAGLPGWSHRQAYRSERRFQRMGARFFQKIQRHIFNDAVFYTLNRLLCPAEAKILPAMAASGAVFCTLNRLLCPAGAKFFRLWLQVTLFFYTLNRLLCPAEAHTPSGYGCKRRCFLYVKNGFRAWQGA